MFIDPAYSHGSSSKQGVKIPATEPVADWAADDPLSIDRILAAFEINTDAMGADYTSVTSPLLNNELVNEPKKDPA